MNDLAWLMQLLDDGERALIANLDATFSDPLSKQEQLRAAAGSVEELQKKYIGQAPEQTALAHLKGRILVASVGFRPHPVILSVLLLRPIAVYLLHSRESRGKAEAIRDDLYVARLGLNPTRDITLMQISLTSAPDNYNALQTIARQHPGAPLVVDVSGGVKVMGVSLAAAAFWQRIPVIYQLGEEVNSTIRPFSEQLTILKNPYEHFGSTELRSIEHLFAVGEYDAAIRVAASMRATIGDPPTLARLDLLEKFVGVYRDWDAFAHSRYDEHPDRQLATRLAAVMAELDRFGMSFADPAALAQNLDFLKVLEGGWKRNERNNSEPYRLIDIYAAAQRRAKSGKYDDAVARLYRCLEMSATICLLRDQGIGSVDKPDYAKWVADLGTLETFAAKFREHARYELPMSRLGLRDQMTLLGLSSNKRHKTISSIFADMENSKLMEMRNRSTLAHGTAPVDKNGYDQIDRKARVILRTVFDKPDTFEQLVKCATHPPISIQL